MSNLRDKYCIVGVGETPYTRGSMKTTKQMAIDAVKNALADCGLGPGDVDGMLSYHANDSTTSTAIATDLGMRLNFYMDCSGGGSSTEALVGIAIGVIEAGMCHTVAIYRSMLGATGVRMGGSGAGRRQLGGRALLYRLYGWSSPAQMFAFTFMRHMRRYGVTSSQLAAIKVAHSKHASNNPRAYYKRRYTVEDVLNSRWIVKPLHLLDCCVETDNATCLIVTSADRARDLRRRPVYIMGVAGRVTKPRTDWHYAYGPIDQVAGIYAAPIVFRNAGVTVDDIDLTGSYDAFTYTTLLQLEAYGFCQIGEGGEYCASGAIELGGRRPNNTSGGHLCEGYTHGMNMVIENVRQLRGQADDYCPNWERGEHSYDYSEGKCRQVRGAEIAMNLGWGTPALTSALILRN